jgi:quinol monooxygenase YgiN
MMTVIARLKVRPGKEAEFERAAREMVAHVKASEPGTVTYVLHRSTADPTVFAFYEVYADAAAFTAHSQSDRMRQFGRGLAGALEGQPEITMYEEIDGKRPAR